MAALPLFTSTGADHAEPGPARGRDRDHLAAVRAGPFLRAVQDRHPRAEVVRRWSSASRPQPPSTTMTCPACACSPRPRRRSAPTSRVRARGDRLPGQAGLRHDRGQWRYPLRARRRPGRPDSIGPALPGVECRIVDPGTGAGCALASRGAAGPHGGRERGYLGDPEATAAHRRRRMGPYRRQHGGEDGWHMATGSRNDKYKGYQVAPAELEAVLRAPRWRSSGRPQARRAGRGVPKAHRAKGRIGAGLMAWGRARGGKRGARSAPTASDRGQERG